MLHLNQIRFWVVLLGFFVLNTGALAQPMPLTGTVVTARSNSAIAGATVAIYDQASGGLIETCTANVQGKFRSAHRFERGEKIRAVFSAEGFVGLTKEYTIKSGKTGNVPLQREAGAPPPQGKPSTPNRPSGTPGGTGTGTGSGARDFAVKGVVKSDKSELLKDVNVKFYRLDREDEIVDSDESVGDGSFKSGPFFKKGDEVIVVLKKNGYSDERVQVSLRNRGRDTTIAVLLKTRIFIAGHVVHTSGTALQDVQISYQRKDGPFVQAVKTNHLGYFDFDVPAPFAPGMDITIRAEKEGYKPEMRTHNIKLQENQVNFIMKRWTEVGIPQGFRIFDDKNRPLKGAFVSYFDLDSMKRIRVPVPENGVLERTIKTEPSKTITFDIERKGYKPYPLKITFGDDGLLKYEPVYLTKNGSKCPCWLYATLGLAGVSGTLFAVSSATLAKHEDPKNLNRLDDYDTGVTQRRISTVAGGLALGAFTGWIICTARESARNEVETERSRHSGLVPWSPPPGEAQGFQIGIAYRF